MSKCDEPGCARPIHVLGLCGTHYHRLCRYGSTHTKVEHDRIREALLWVLDGDALTTPLEREFYDGDELAA